MAKDTEEAASSELYPILQGCLVLILGGAGGIGGKLIENFAQQGAQVVLIEEEDDGASNLIGQLTPSFALAPVYFPCDLGDCSALELCLTQVVDRFGAMDVVIHNASDNCRAAAGASNPTDLCTAIDRKHEAFAAHAAVPGMKWQGGHVVLNMSAMPWMISSGEMPAYAASKTAVTRLTRAFAHELEPKGVAVNCILPGAIETARKRRYAYTSVSRGDKASKRELSPEDIARLAFFLATDSSTSYARPAPGESWS